MLFCVLVVSLLQLAHTSYTPTRRQIRYVDSLVRRWAPLVWLAPGERFFPGGVEQFLDNVYPVPSKIAYKFKSRIKNDDNQNSTTQKDEHAACDQSCQLKLEEELSPFKDLPLGIKSKDWFLLAKEEMGVLLKNASSFIHGYNPLLYSVPVYALVTHCPPQKKAKPPSPMDHSTPHAPHHIHQPNFHPVMKNPTEEFPAEGADKNYRLNYEKERIKDKIAEDVHSQVFNGKEMKTNHQQNDLPPNALGSNEDDIQAENNHGSFKTHLRRRDIPNDQAQSPAGPDFIVTYWLFFPFSEGKDVCVVETGPRLLGPWPLPLLGGHCLGKRRRYGSHLGDWEHLSIRFVNGHPHSLYISTHKLGAYYKYIHHKNGLFGLYRHELRDGGHVEGWLQRPRFPPVVHLMKPLQATPAPNIPNSPWVNGEMEQSRPTLFAARGSHGLWAAPGHHQYVRYPRVEDRTGYGIPWATWTNLQILHHMTGPPSDCLPQKNRDGKFNARLPPGLESVPQKVNGMRNGEGFGAKTADDNIVVGKGGGNDCSAGGSDWPTWMAYEGHWGEPRQGCHEALSKLGVGGWSCHFSDGPRGIPAKRSHFSCNYPL